MKLEYVPVKSQKFDIGRTINLSECDCEKCDFMNCPKNNYAVKVTRKKYTVDVFYGEWKEKILELNKPRKWQYSFHDRYMFLLTYDMIVEFFDTLAFSFPNGTYWQPISPKSFDGEIGDRVYESIALVKFARNGGEITLGEIQIHNATVIDYDLSERQYKLAHKIAENIKWLKEKVFEFYQECDLPEGYSRCL